MAEFGLWEKFFATPGCRWMFSCAQRAFFPCAPYRLTGKFINDKKKKGSWHKVFWEFFFGQFSFGSLAHIPCRSPSYTFYVRLTLRFVTESRLRNGITRSRERMASHSGISAFVPLFLSLALFFSSFFSFPPSIYLQFALLFRVIASICKISN